MKDRTSEASTTRAPNGELPGDSFVVVRQVTAADMLAYSIATAAIVVDLSYATIYREIRRGKIRQTHFGLITRTELLRYLAAGEAAKPRAKRRSLNVRILPGDPPLKKNEAPVHELERTLTALQEHAGLP